MPIDRQSRARARLDRYDTALLEFAERWQPFGGGHEYVFAEFGLDIDEFYRQLQRIRQRLRSHE